MTVSGGARRAAAFAGPASSVFQVQTSKVCQLTGENDRQFNPPRPTLNRTATSWGLRGTDNGYSFTWNGNLWFLFGDSNPTPIFNGRPNSQNYAPRNLTNNDAIAYASAQAGEGCPRLTFPTDTLGAFANPSVQTTTDQPPVTLRTNEIPIAGIAAAGHMYVLFGTDNFASNPAGQPGSPNGGPTRSVMAELIDPATLTFGYLYDFSAGASAKFIFNAIAIGPSGWVYFWGAEGGQTGYRHSPIFLARKQANTMAQPGGIQYFSGFGHKKQPIFTSSETTAAPLFSDSPACTGEHSVDWNRYLRRWMLLYNCANNTPAHARGIWMRTAPNPWGPWSPPQTIFATKAGLCVFIHRAITQTRPPCDQLATAERTQVQGGDYSPDIISPFTTGARATAQTPPTTTIYYTMSTWNPYQVVVMKTTLDKTGTP